jgi:hypothetical protein
VKSRTTRDYGSDHLLKKNSNDLRREWDIFKPPADLDGITGTRESKMANFVLDVKRIAPHRD